MKKITFSFTIILLSLFISKAQTIHCDSFAVLNITIDTVGSNMLSVTISNLSSGQVNYPSVLVTNAAGDTVANPTEMFFFFAQIAHDTLVHTIPTMLDSLPCNATYTIYYSDNSSHDSCVFTYYYSCTAGIGEVAGEDGFNIYPNPTTGNLTIRQFGNLTIKEIKILDILGQTIQQLTTNNQQLNLDISYLPKGIYFVRIESFDKLRMTNSMVNRKIIKQ